MQQCTAVAHSACELCVCCAEHIVQHCTAAAHSACELSLLCGAHRAAEHGMQHSTKCLRHMFVCNSNSRINPLYPHRPTPHPTPHHNTSQHITLPHSTTHPNPPYLTPHRITTHHTQHHNTPPHTTSHHTPHHTHTCSTTANTVWLSRCGVQPTASDLSDDATSKSWSAD
jgi:hypothetical protein